MSLLPLLPRQETGLNGNCIVSKELLSTSGTLRILRQKLSECGVKYSTKYASSIQRAIDTLYLSVLFLLMTYAFARRTMKEIAKVSSCTHYNDRMLLLIHIQIVIYQ